MKFTPKVKSKTAPHYLQKDAVCQAVWMGVGQWICSLSLQTRERIMVTNPKMALSTPLCNRFPVPAISSPPSSSSSSRKQLHPVVLCNYVSSNALPIRWATHRSCSAATAPPRARIKCFSRRQLQSDESESEFERLFSNLNQATLKREPGCSPSITLSLSLSLYMYVYIYIHVHLCV